MAADRFLIRRWLAAPHVAAWWGSRESGEAAITLAMQSPSALCRMIVAGGQAVGYGHAVDIGLWGETLPPDVPAGAYDIDAFVGEAVQRGRGIGGTAVRLLAEEVFATTLACACCVFAPIKNEAAVRAYEKAGFRWRHVWQDPIDGPSWVMILERGRPSART
jgi:RimJ/RimL family protein N-acetyltransferase